MAKATSPLFAVEASGQVGKAIVYDRRGYVRMYTKPANPKTDGQGNIRTPFRAVAAIIKATGQNAKADLKTKAEPSYRWNAWLVREMLGKSLAAWDASMAAFSGLAATAQQNWDDAAQNAGINPTPMPYDQNPPDHLAGRALYAAARVLTHAGLGPGEPTADNATAWANYITS